MVIGVPKELKEGEYRVAITPANVSRLTGCGHKVLIEKDAGKEAQYSDAHYQAAGAEIAESLAEIYRQAELVVKVKELFPVEFDLLQEKHILMTYIHSANRREQTEALLNKKVVAFAYEDVKNEKGEYPLLMPMSELAGAMGTLMGVYHSFNTSGGCGRLVGGAPGTASLKFVVFGAGNVGLSAARLALKMGAEVTILDVDVQKLRDTKSHLLPEAKTMYSSPVNVLEAIADADVVLNAVKWAPGLKIVTKDMLKAMKPNALIVDVDAEPGGAIETCRYSTIDDPVYTVDGIRHICVPNLPSMVANTASDALSNATIPYILDVANKGWHKAAVENKALRFGLDFVKGYLTFQPTAEAFGLTYVDTETVLNKF